MRFKNQVVIVTGASSGIGEACAVAFAREGAKVALIARREDRLKKISDKLKKEKLTAEPFVCDVRNENEIAHLVKDVEKKLGSCDVLINNAGIPLMGPVEKNSTEEIDNLFQTNLRAPILFIQQVLPAMKKRKKGTIINISSIAGKVGLKNFSIYCASKFGLSGFSQALLEEVREYGIKVADICPGMVNTEIHGGKYPKIEKDMIRPADVAEAALLAAAAETCNFSEIWIRPKLPLSP